MKISKEKKHKQTIAAKDIGSDDNCDTLSLLADSSLKISWKLLDSEIPMLYSEQTKI